MNSYFRDSFRGSEEMSFVFVDDSFGILAVLRLVAILERGVFEKEGLAPLAKIDLVRLFIWSKR